MNEQHPLSNMIVSFAFYVLPFFFLVVFFFYFFVLLWRHCKGCIAADFNASAVIRPECVFVCCYL